jgi:energy-coupling factor transport system permease protein
MRVIQDITLGQYMPGSSVVHRLDPRTKMMALFIIIVTTFGTDNIFALFALLFFIVAAAKTASLSLSFLFRGVKVFFWLFAFTAMFHLLFTAGDSFYPFPVFGISITSQGIAGGSVVFFQLLSVVLAANIFTLTTSPHELICGVEALLKPFKRFGLRAEEAALMVSLVIRFIPVLKEETIRVLKAQQSRGIEFGSGNIVNRARHIVSVIGPVFNGLLVRTDTLVLAMTSRGFDSQSERGALRELKLKGDDILIFFATALFSLALFLKY